jgi:hypothetical protein
MAKTSLIAIIQARRAARLFVAKSHEDLIAYDFHFVRPGRPGRGHRERGACFDIKFGAVPWACDGLGFRIDWPFAKRASVMRADIIERVIMTGRVNQYDQSFADFDQQ